MQGERDGLALFIEQASKHRLLSAAEEQELAKRIELGDHRAKQILVEHNLRLAISAARRWQHAGVPLEDLIQEAVIGLHRAADKFDWRKNFKFSTYAMWWIRHMIQRALHKDRATIRVPGHVLERKRRIEKYLREHPGSSIEDAADHIDITVEQAEDALDGTRVVASLDAPFTSDDGDGGSRHSMIPDDDAADPAEMALDRHPRLTQALVQLEPIQRQVIELRFGFGGEVKSRDEVADLLGIRPHAVQRAQREALAALKEELS